MKKVGNKTYPDKIKMIVRDKQLLKAFGKHVQKEVANENLFFYLTGYKPKVMYERFLAVDSEYEVNIDGPTRGKMKRLADAGQWRHPDWPDLIASAKKSVAYLLETDTLVRFWSSDFFLDYHAKNGGARDDARSTVDDPPPPPAWELAAEEFGIKDVAKLRFYIAKFERSGERATVGDAAKLLRSEGKKMNGHIFNKLLINGGFAKKPADWNPKHLADDPADTLDDLPELDADTGEQTLRDVSGMEITLYHKMLQKCGFTLVKRPIDLDRIEHMVRAHLAKDRPEAILIYSKILKAENKKQINKKLDATPYVEVMKALVKEKAFKVSRTA